MSLRHSVLNLRHSPWRSMPAHPSGAHRTRAFLLALGVAFVSSALAGGVVGVLVHERHVEGAAGKGVAK